MVISQLKQQENMNVSNERVAVSGCEEPSKLPLHGKVKEKNQDELPDYLNNVNKIEDIIEISQSSQGKSLPFELEAINLYEKGYTLEQIAKKLNKGKTEIQLLLKFRRK
ncbi:hypothetical protein [Bacillus sp. SA1-12]|uniref:hypothetical protein n=1 Tax=Bacillus sp. SA1-12 TaxID=1455638 RepID=UPI000A07D669|nr:hypothetical protein [Bacillus sp. SA1-12]